MSSNPETSLTSSILKRLKSTPGCLAIKIHGNEHTRTGEPDIVGSFNGQSFAMELKIPGNKPSLIQGWRLWEWKQAGAYIGVVYSVSQAMAVIKGDTSYEPDFKEIHKRAFVGSSSEGD